MDLHIYMNICVHGYAYIYICACMDMHIISNYHLPHKLGFHFTDLCLVCT